MKTLWNALAIVAVANMLALLGVVGWLVSGERLDAERAARIRAMLTETIPAEKARLEAEQQKLEAERAAQAQAQRDARPPLTAQEKLAARLEATEIDRQRAQRLRREVEDLQAALLNQRAALERDRAELETERRAFEAASSRQRDLARNEQFQKSLATLAALKPAEAVRVLLQVLEMPEEGERALAGGAASAMEFAPVSAGGAADVNDPQSGAGGAAAAAARPGLPRVVLYLNAMDDRPRGRIMSEFVKSDPRLAAELLERLRQGEASTPGPQANAR